VFEVEQSVLEQSTSEICNIMQDVARIKVPLLVDAGHGKNWALAH